MISEYVHEWDQPKQREDRTHQSVLTTPQQALTGLPIGLATLEVPCESCNRRVREGEQIVVYAYRAADAPEWLLTRCSCTDCAVPRIDTATLGTNEVLVEARLDVVSLTDEQRHQLCLSDVEVLAFSPLTEGTSP